LSTTTAGAESCQSRFCPLRLRTQSFLQLFMPSFSTSAGGLDESKGALGWTGGLDESKEAPRWTGGLDESKGASGWTGGLDESKGALG
jgi:hypothetical protein